MGRKTVNFLGDEEIANSIKNTVAYMTRETNFIKTSEPRLYHTFLFLRFCFLLIKTITN